MTVKREPIRIVSGTGLTNDLEIWVGDTQVAGVAKIEFDRMEINDFVRATLTFDGVILGEDKREGREEK